MKIPAHLAPAAYLQKAATDYKSLVPTHPMEKDEWEDGLAACKTLVTNTIYGGKWPENIPAIEEEVKVGEPQANGGLTRTEQLLSQDLVNFWNSLPQGGHIAQIATVVHTCQSTLESRILRRAYPDYWTNIPGSLAQDASAEKERWNLAD